LRNQQFFDLASLNKAVKEKIREHNQTRMQQKPYCREEKYLADEKHLPASGFRLRITIEYLIVLGRWKMQKTANTVEMDLA